MLVVVWAVLWAIGTVWSGVDTARSAVADYVLGTPGTPLVADASVGAALAHPSASTLIVRVVGLEFAPAAPASAVVPLLTFEATNADFNVDVPPVLVRVTLDWSLKGWSVKAVDRVP